MKEIRRIGLLTGGGDCPGLNAVIRAVVKTAILKYDYQVTGIEDGFDGLLKKGKTRQLILKDVAGIIGKGGTILGTTNRGNPFEYKKKVRGKWVEADVSDKAVDTVNKLNIDVLTVIGGDGSLKIANRFWKEKGVPVVGIPKTIDNDLMATDMTFGFQTAVETATDAIDKLHTTAESHHRVMIVETMGRYVGWIALYAGIAGGADVIIIPEIPYDITKVIDRVYERSKRGRRFSIICVAEGSKPVGGDVSVLAEKQMGSVERVGGIGEKIADEITGKTGLETRVTVLGHIQRGGSPNSMDRILSTRYGKSAVDLVHQKKFGEMVCLRTPYIRSVEIGKAVSKFKAVDPEGQVVTTAETTGISFGR